MNRDEYLEKCAKCRQHLDKVKDGKVVEVGPFISSLKYVLEMKTGRPCIIYNTNYGELDFTINGVRFKFLWPPKSANIVLICRHLEGEKFIDSGIDITVPDLFQELVDNIEFCMNHVTPFDV
jgi:hypothetical protein